MLENSKAFRRGRGKQACKPFLFLFFLLLQSKKGFIYINKRAGPAPQPCFGFLAVNKGIKENTMNNQQENKPFDLKGRILLRD